MYVLFSVEWEAWIAEGEKGGRNTLLLQIRKKRGVKQQDMSFIYTR